MIDFGWLIIMTGVAAVLFACAWAVYKNGFDV